MGAARALPGRQHHPGRPPAGRDTRALLPLTRSRSLPRVLRSTAPWPAPDRPPICAPEDADRAVRDLAGQLRDRGGWELGDEFAEVALERAWLRLWTSTLDGQPVAADFALRFAGTESVFMAGMDPAYRDSHAGMELHYHLVREAIADGVAEFRLLRGDQPYKDDLPNENRPVSRLVLTGSLPGRLAVAGRAAGTRLRAAARRRTPGAGSPSGTSAAERPPRPGAATA